MRKFLLWLGTVWVGTITLVVLVSLMIGVSSSAGAFLGSIVLWLFALAGGLALSAPAFLNPPDDNGGVWSFRLPLPLWMFLMMLKLVSWMGFYILLGTWMLIFKVWHNHQNNRLPTFSNAGQPPQQPAYVPQNGTAIPASWQADPTGRYPHRWWDGVRWTDRVANGSVQAVDPL
jgi:energy-coupling factor transporter transmembrane protein EcfT